MSSNFDSTEFIQEENSRPTQRGKSCLFVGLLLILITSLLASSVYSIIWFFDREQTANETPMPTLTPEAMAAANDSNEQSIPTPKSQGATAVVPAPSMHNRIVLINSENQIETVAPDGSDRQTLTSKDDIIFQFPAWAPDGSQIAAIGGKSNGAGVFTLSDINNADDTANLQELYFSGPQNPFYLYWSPDSRQISFLANKPSEGLGLNLLDVADTTSNRVIATGSPVYWNWTQNSTEMLLHAGGQNDARLVLIDREGRDMAPEIPSPGLFQTPGISKNGRYWAFSQFKKGNTSWLVIQDKQTGEHHEERHAGSLALSWSPTADKLAYISGNANDNSIAWGALRLYDTETAETTLLSSDLVLAFFWSPDGEKIAILTAPFSQGFENEQQVNGGIKNVRTTKTIPVQRNPHQFKLSVININTGEGVQIAEIIPSITFMTQFIPFFDQYALSHRLWSPNSDKLVLPIIEDQENKIVVFPASGGKRTEIGSGDSAFWSQN